MCTTCRPTHADVIGSRYNAFQGGDTAEDIDADTGAAPVRQVSDDAP